jgi:hypothetical protein
MNELKIIDNNEYQDQINDLYPIEIYVNNKVNQKNLWRKTLTENYKVNKTLGSINYNRLKQIKIKQLKEKRRSKN